MGKVLQFPKNVTPDKDAKQVSLTNIYEEEFFTTFMALLEKPKQSVEKKDE